MSIRVLEFEGTVVAIEPHLDLTKKPYNIPYWGLSSFGLKTSNEGETLHFPRRPIHSTLIIRVFLTSKPNLFLYNFPLDTSSALWGHAQVQSLFYIMIFQTFEAHYQNPINLLFSRLKIPSSFN